MNKASFEKGCVCRGDGELVPHLPLDAKLDSASLQADDDDGSCPHNTCESKIGASITSRSEMNEERMVIWLMLERHLT